MKKVIILCIFIICLSGCTSTKEESLENILAYGMTSNVSITNVYRTGYKYYLPRGMKNITSQDYNEVIYSDQYAYYMYVDVVSYFNSVREEYEENEEYYYSKALFKGNLFGYLQIKSLEEDKYFVEIMYNYAKIEVIVDKENIPNILLYGMSILSSISYQDEVLANLMGEDALKANEVVYNIFESAETESEYLQIVEEYGQYEEKDEIVDPDFIRR